MPPQDSDAVELADLIAQPAERPVNVSDVGEECPRDDVPAIVDDAENGVVGFPVSRDVLFPRDDLAARGEVSQHIAQIERVHQAGVCADLGPVVEDQDGRGVGDGGLERRWNQGSQNRQRKKPGSQILH